MKKKIPPRKTLSRDDHYMRMAFATAGKSKDPRTQVGAQIVSKTNEPISSGYNGPPAKIDDKKIDWDRPQKYPFIHHAEDNSIWYGRLKCMEGATIYVTAPPCKSCMLDIVRSGITRVVFYRPPADAGSLLANKEEWEVTQDIAKKGGLKLEEYKGDVQKLKDLNQIT